MGEPAVHGGRRPCAQARRRAHCPRRFPPVDPRPRRDAS